MRVCDHCRAAVVRTDRGAETLGQFADLMPMSSALRLFAEGRHGTTGFLLIGMAQLKHAAGGVWQEWYAKLDGGQWAWISEAQGRLYLTLERPELAVPALAALAPGSQTAIGGAPFTVAERGTATYVSALGEIPYRLVPGSTFQFVDLSDGRGGFATIDYGDGSDPPAVYVGYEVTPQGLGIAGGEAALQLLQPATGARLACPSCNGSLELRVPDQTLRVACPYCNSLVSVEGGTLAIIAKQAKQPVIAIALGSKATFDEGELTVVGYVGRSAYVDGAWWPFEEYLLHAPSVGFRWLVCSDGHWSYVQPVASGAVSLGTGATYDGVAFQRFQLAELRVDSVLGELYWRVTAGERVRAEDFIAPPAMLSREASAQEENWSLSTYRTTKQLDQAFGVPLGLPAPLGVGPNQPYPAGIGKVSALVLVTFFAVGIGKCASAPAADKLRAHFAIPTQSATPRPAVDPSLGVVPSSDPAIDPAAGGQPAAPSEPAGAVMFSDKFELVGGKNLELDLRANVNDNWAYAAIDLINDATGGVRSFDKSIEYYSGFDSDGSWSEGSRTADEVIAPVERGTYLLRVEAQHGGSSVVDLDITVRQGVFRWIWFWIALGVLAVPFGLVALHAYAFRKRRWENSSLVAHTPISTGGDDGDDDDD